MLTMESDLIMNQYDGWWTLQDPNFGTFANAFRSYLLSYIRTGDPNKLRGDSTIWWPKPRAGPSYDMVLDAGNRGFNLITDEVLVREDCSFWMDLWKTSTELRGR
jgi:hypothetical protein